MNNILFWRTSLEGEEGTSKKKTVLENTFIPEACFHLLKIPGLQDLCNIVSISVFKNPS